MRTHLTDEEFNTFKLTYRRVDVKSEENGTTMRPLD